MLEEKFNSLGRFLKTTFGERVHRMNINIPGKKFDPSGKPHGYILCSGGSLEAPATETVLETVEKQIESAKGRVREKFKSGMYIVHFHTNTGESVDMETLSNALSSAIQDNEIIGINVTIRVDSIDDKLVNYLADISQYIYLWVEVGLHTIHDQTLEKLGLNFRYKDSITAIDKLIRKDIRISLHMVFGLPGETDEMMKQTMEKVSSLPIKGINIHHYYLLKDSPMADAYKNGNIKFISMEEYASLACDLIEMLAPEVVLRTIAGGRGEPELLAPDWTTRKQDTVKAISSELERRETKQGSKNHIYVQQEAEEEEIESMETASVADNASESEDSDNA